MHFILVKITVSYHYLGMKALLANCINESSNYFFLSSVLICFPPPYNDKNTNLVSFIYILADAFDPEERIASNFSLKYHKDKGNDHYVKRLKVV